MTTPAYKKPLPNINDRHMRPYWEAAKRHELRAQRCPSCGYIRLPAAKFCPECLEENNEWVQLSGKGTIWSFNVYHHVFNQAFKDDIPYNVALIQLAEGPRLISNIVGVPNEALSVGMSVEVAFDDVTEEVTLVKFRPATTADA